MIFLLDTNACVHAIKGEPPGVSEKVQRAVRAGDTVTVSTIVMTELWFGAARSGNMDRNLERLAAFLVPLNILPFDIEAARTAGSIRAELARKGQTIGAYDCLIAGHAMRLGATLVTANAREFRRIDGLNCRNWAE